MFYHNNFPDEIKITPEVLKIIMWGKNSKSKKIQEIYKDWSGFIINVDKRQGDVDLEKGCIYDPEFILIHEDSGNAWSYVGGISSIDDYYFDEEELVFESLDNYYNNIKELISVVLWYCIIEGQILKWFLTEKDAENQKNKLLYPTNIGSVQTYINSDIYIEATTNSAV